MTTLLGRYPVARLGCQQCALGEGTLDIPAILDILGEHGYDGYYNLEFGGDNSDELIRKSLAYLEKLKA